MYSSIILEFHPLSFQSHGLDLDLLGVFFDEKVKYSIKILENKNI